MFASCAQCRGQKAKSLVSNRRKAKGAGAPSLVTVVGKSVRAPAFAAASSPSPEQPPSLPPLITAGALQGRKQGPGRTDAWRRRGGASASARRSSRGRGSIRASWPHSSPTTAPELADAAPEMERFNQGLLRATAARSGGALRMRRGGGRDVQVGGGARGVEGCGGGTGSKRRRQWCRVTRRPTTAAR